MDRQTALALLRAATAGSVRGDAPDLTLRQLAVLLTVYLDAPPHTVRGLAARLNVSKPAITRALDRLGELHLIRRKVDQEDRRNVLIQRTVVGSVFLNDVAELMTRAGPDGALTLRTQAHGVGRL